MNYLFDFLKAILTFNSKPNPLASENANLKERIKELKSIIKYCVVALVLISSLALISTTILIEILMHNVGGI